ncbi:MAG: ABC transporter permease [Thermodesulfobacteriota bacterium]|nr:ABC transporter permease [Thermodesulfobacteriota bacterium]
MRNNYFLTKLISSFLVLLIVTSSTFVLLRTLPGGPFDSEKKLPPAIKENIEKKYQLDQPIQTQYLSYMKNILRFDLGPSYFYTGKTVNEIISKSFPFSLKIGSMSLIFTVIASLGLAVFLFRRENQLSSKIINLLLYASVGVPMFLLGAVLIIFFSVQLSLFPAALLEKPTSYILPVLTLSIPSIAFLTKLMVETMNETNSSMFVRNATINNIDPGIILNKYIVKNSLIPFITAIGPIAAFMITGSFVVESIYSIPGMGRMFVLSIINRDYPLICGLTLIYTMILISINMLIDFIYPFLDKRIKI